MCVLFIHQIINNKNKMRRIDRFRAFDNRIKTMYPFVILGWNGAIEARLDKDDAGSVNDIRNYHLNGVFEDYPDCEIDIEQNIGLVDKKDKDVYEGDILELIPKYYGAEPKLLVVKFNEETASFEFYKTNKDIFNFRDIDFKYTEIIGNIHENSDLLS